MSDTETRALRRAVVVLLVVSAGRAAWSAARPPPEAPGPDALPRLLEESRKEAREEETRGRPLGAEETLDPNRAPAVELDRLPGVGPTTARAVVQARDSGGPFVTPEDLLRVRGIGDATLSRILPHLDLSRPPPVGLGRPVGASERTTRVDVNEASDEALQALPGIGPALARRIVEERGRGRFKSVEELARVRGIGPATVERLRPLVSVGRLR